MSRERELQFVRLSEEEVTEILTSSYDMYSTICAVENRLADKNRINKSDPRSLLEIVIMEVDSYKHWNISDFLYDEISNFLEQSKSDPDSIDLQSRCRGDKL
jgi:hypothetical protein